MGLDRKRKGIICVISPQVVVCCKVSSLNTIVHVRSLLKFVYGLSVASEALRLPESSKEAYRLSELNRSCDG